MNHVVYADIDEQGHVRYVGKGTRSRYYDPDRSYWGRTTWRPARRIVLYRAGSDEAVRVLESVAIKQYLDAGADLFNARRPSIPDLAKAAEARRRSEQVRMRREKEARRARRLAQARWRAEEEERARLEQEQFAEVARRLEEENERRTKAAVDEKQRRKAEAAAAMARLQLLWDRRGAGLEPDVGRGLTERSWSWRNPFRKIEVAHLRAVGWETRLEYRHARMISWRRRGFRTRPTRTQLVIAELISMLKTLPGMAAVTTAGFVFLIVLVMWWRGII